ncbi:MAG: DUF6677 family protein [Phycisphaerae bacterium]
MSEGSNENNYLRLGIIAAIGWLVPGGGYWLLGEYKRSIIVFCTIILTFCIGIYVGSIGVIDPVQAKPWFAAQMLNSPLVAILGETTKSGEYLSYGRPNEIGQLYTSISGLLNLLCIINSVYLGHTRKIRNSGD